MFLHGKKCIIYIFWAVLVEGVCLLLLFCPLICRTGYCCVPQPQPGLVAEWRLYDPPPPVFILSLSLSLLDLSVLVNINLQMFVSIPPSCDLLPSVGKQAIQQGSINFGDLMLAAQWHLYGSGVSCLYGSCDGLYGPGSIYLPRPRLYHGGFSEKS